MIKRLPENERDPYLSWDDFNRLVDHSWWLKDVITMMYYSGMRFGEVIGLRWEMCKPERRMLVLPPKATKEGKSAKKPRSGPKGFLSARRWSNYWNPCVRVKMARS